MNKSLSGKTIVFVGVFQPSKFDKFFFIKNNILNEEEILDSSVFRQDIVQLYTSDVSIVIFATQIIFTQLKITQDRIKEISSIFISVVKPDVTAAGINFTWNIIPRKSLEEDSKMYFLNEKNKMFSNFFNTPDSIYGSYVSKDILNGRLKLDIKPQNINQGTNVKSFVRLLNFAFNFHFDIDSKDNHVGLLKTIDNYNQLLSESEKIMYSYE